MADGADNCGSEVSRALIPIGECGLLKLQVSPGRRLASCARVLGAKVGDRRRFYAVLHLGGIRSPLDAVRAAIVAERRAKT
jgi:hypothetical protein